MPEQQAKNPQWITNSELLSSFSRHDITVNHQSDAIFKFTSNNRVTLNFSLYKFKI